MKYRYDSAITCCAISIFVIVFSFLYPSGVYRKWSLNIFELSVMLNLVVLSISINTKRISRNVGGVELTTYVSISSSSCVIKLDLSTLSRRSFATCFRRAVHTLTDKKQKRLIERFSACNAASRVTSSEIQVSIPPNEASQLLNVSSSPHTKSFHEPKETLLENCHHLEFYFHYKH